MKASILQTPAWQTFQNHLGETTFFQQTPDFQYLAIKKSTPVGPYLYLPYGPYLPSKHSAKAAYHSLLTLARAQNAIFIRIEPQNPSTASYLLQLPNCKKVSDLNPAHTLIIDLSPDKSALLSAIPRRTRGYFNNFAKKGLQIEVSTNPDDIQYLVQLQKTLAATKKIGIFSETYLKKQLAEPFSKLYLVKYTPPKTDSTPHASNATSSTPANPLSATTQTSSSNITLSTPTTPQVIAAVLVFDSVDTRHYIQAAQDKSYTKLAAPSIVVCQMLMDAKDLGLKYFDFWGIAPADAPANHPWAGFTAFKKSFGGTPVEYAGTYDIVLHPAKYQFYRSLRQLNRAKRKLLHQQG